YRGAAIPEIVGRYFFADHCSATVVSLKIVNGAATDCIDHSTELTPGGGMTLQGINSFGENALGELFMCSDFVLFKMMRDPPLPDADADGVPDAVDNCPNVPNPDQADNDKDGL